MVPWVLQESCTILASDNQLLGFCGPADEPEIQGTITLFYPSRSAVDERYAELQGRALGPAKENPRFRIYQFFARDPEGRLLEFQYFDHEVPFDFHDGRVTAP